MGSQAQTVLSTSTMFGGVVWRPQANARWTEKEQRIEIISEETHQAPVGPALFFFLHCRASTRHGRSTTGILSRKES